MIKHADINDVFPQLWKQSDKKDFTDLSGNDTPPDLVNNNKSHSKQNIITKQFIDPFTIHHTTNNNTLKQ